MLGKKDEVIHLVNEWLNEELEDNFDQTVYDQKRKEAIINKCLDWAEAKLLNKY
jgi:hypothetical protein